MKRRVGRRLVSSLLLCSLLAGGLTALPAGAGAESWPQESSVDEQGRTIKTVPAENGKTEIWELVGIFGGEEELLQSIGFEKTKKADIGEKTFTVEMKKVGDKQSEEYTGALEEKRFGGSKSRKAKARRKQKDRGASAEPASYVKWKMTENSGSVRIVGTRREKVLTRRRNRRTQNGAMSDASVWFGTQYPSGAKASMIQMRNLQEDGKTLSESGPAGEEAAKLPAPGIGEDSGWMITEFRKLLLKYGRAKKMTKIVGWTDPANLIYLQDNRGSGL